MFIEVFSLVIPLMVLLYSDPPSAPTGCMFPGPSPRQTGPVLQQSLREPAAVPRGHRVQRRELCLREFSDAYAHPRKNNSSCQR